MYSINKDNRIKLKEKLKINANKPFGDEFIRTTDLEMQIIDEYGFEGIQLIFEPENSANYFLLGQFPNDCPWITYNDKSIDEFISLNFLAIRDKIPQLISTMQKKCRFIYAEKQGQKWYLHYWLISELYDRRNYYCIYTGGSPQTNLKENGSLVKFKWTLPSDLQEFYSIHNGFGEVNGRNCILNHEQIKVMGEIMNPICQEQNITPEGYSFNDLLEFFPDGAGNAQCFLRKDNKHYQTVDWDHETWEISEEQSFYEFVDEWLSQIDEE